MPPRTSSSSKPPGGQRQRGTISSLGNTNLSSKPPANWPAEITYLMQPVYSNLIETSTLHLLCPNPTVKGHRDSIHPPGPCPFVKIKKITTTDHPAFGQCGLFANQQLQPGHWVLDYLGYVHPAAETDPASDYDLSLDRELQGGVGVDARRMGNEARFINDYRGIPERMKKISPSNKGAKPGPNVMFSERVVEGTGERRLCIVVGKEKIRKGEELCVSYGKGFWKERGIEHKTALLDESYDHEEQNMGE